jgi:predicted amidophosphoribosyltransferase
MFDWRSLRTDLADLVLARTCAGCESPGTILCEICWAHLTRGLIEHDLPDGASALTSTTYLGVGRSVIIAHKEHGWHALTPMLGILLARAVTSLTAEPVSLVPIPPHAHSLSVRGTDPLVDIARAAARYLRSIGQPARCDPLLTRAREGGSVKKLDRAARRASVESSFVIARRRRPHAGQLIIVDDVITTGTTITEARRALESGGVSVCGAAAVASTPLRTGLR